MAVLWLRFLTEIDRDTEEIPAELLENPDTSKALKILEKSAYNEAELRAYEYYWDAVYNERGAIRHGYKQGLEQGMEQGMERGLEQGLKQGLEQGRAEGERQKSLEIARRMKSKGVPSEDIADMTGLTATEIDLL